MTGPNADLEWRPGNVPVSRRFEDPFYSLDNGFGEAWHVFLGGNDLPEGFRPGFQIAELGFGTGLNLLVALRAWREAGISGQLRFVSFEAYPLTAGEMEAALSAFPQIADEADLLLTHWRRGHNRIEAPDLVAEIVFGDARVTLPRWQGMVDAWFLDGFAPARNPELWEPDLLAGIGRRTRPGGTCATYTAAGCVRRGLADAGFAVRKVPGFGRKRHMTVGRLA